MKTRRELRLRRKLRIKATVRGTSVRPRAVVFRSHTHLTVQFIDDQKQLTLLSGTSKGKNKKDARDLGTAIANDAKSKGIASIVFDRGGYRYHGVIEALAASLREGGLIF